MNDEKIEQLLRELPAPELSPAWREEILGRARRAGAESARRQLWPEVMLYLRNLCLRNPVTATAMVALWSLIFLFKFTTPDDPAARVLLAHMDPSRPVYFVSISEEILFAEMEMDRPDQKPVRQIP